jgi:hypothetical protein
VPRSGSDAERLAALEAEIAAMRGELAELRGRVGRIEPQERRAPAAAAPPAPAPATAAETAPPPRVGAVPLRDMATSARAQSAPSRTDLLESRPRPEESRPRPGTPRSSLSGVSLESWVGRYGTLLAAASVILLGIGTLVVWAVQRGLLSPPVRVALGAVATACVAVAGLQFRRKGERRYGNVLLALSLAMTAVVAWGAGPQLHIIPSGAALAVVDLVALAIAALATRDDSEFLFAVAIGGTLFAPFITSDNKGRPDLLLAYGAVVILGGLRGSNEPEWRSAPILLVAGAVVYELAAASLPAVPGWYGPYSVTLFGGALALGALVLAEPAWRSGLARAFLASTFLGVLFGWDAIPGKPAGITALISLGLLATTYAALWIDRPEQILWEASALVLPWLSLGVAEARAEGRAARSVLFVGWGLVALAMWRAERWRSRFDRGGVHLLLGTLLVAIGTAYWFWPNPLAFVAALGALALVGTFLVRDEESALPTIGPALVLIGVAMSAIDQLASLQAYAYTPFATRASASAFVALLSVAGSAVLLLSGRGSPSRVFSRANWVAATVGLAFIWGRMELVHAFSRDASTFLLTLYYAATGVAGIVAGRRADNKGFRVAGLVVAIYAALKAVIEATNIDNLLLRVGCYAAVGVFLLGAAYLYRNAELEEEGVGAGDPASGATSI